ncbi:MAG TPA: sugar phosphate nucleotidyltransferase [Ignavibacteria bacterium]|mgnify:CR=1 FL=1|nr:sugar phosphate nucleotidyltransferase [Ignavibacteria bacterium]
MEEFLGVLFCGGRGIRIGKLTKYISKSFIPVYDKPVFEFGLELLINSRSVSEIILLTNNDNDDKLRKLGFRTIIQDDSRVTDMFSGWDYVKEVTGTKKHGVLIPSDNICKIKVDKLIEKFITKKAGFLFSLHRIKDKIKLSEMGSYDPENKKFIYKNRDPKSAYGVIAPYIIRNDLNYKTDINIFENKNSYSLIHRGYWFDLGDYESIADANAWFRRKNKIKQAGL